MKSKFIKNLVVTLFVASMSIPASAASITRVSHLPPPPPRYRNNYDYRYDRHARAGEIADTMYVFGTLVDVLDRDRYYYHGPRHHHRYRHHRRHW